MELIVKKVIRRKQLGLGIHRIVKVALKLIKFMILKLESVNVQEFYHLKFPIDNAKILASGNREIN